MNKKERDMFLKITQTLSEKERSIWNTWRSRLWNTTDMLNDYANSTSDIGKHRQEQIRLVHDWAQEMPILTKDEIMFSGEIE